jgi:3-(methylthio)propanoyl-CoA dehydrogenase
MSKRLGDARRALLEAVDFVAGQTKASPNAVFAGSVPYLMLAGTAVAGWQMARALIAAEDRLAAGEDIEFMKAKITTARFFADHLLVRCGAWRDAIVDGAESVTELPLEAF